MKQKKITSIKQYIEVIMKKREESISLGLNKCQWFFRGQKNSTWSVEPNIFRNDGLAKESDNIQLALRQNPFDFRDCNSRFEVLTKLQHYGLGTRLLDVTLNPLVALYFATEEAVDYVENKNGQYAQRKQDGAIYTKCVAWHSDSELCLRIASFIPFIKTDPDFTLEKFLGNLRKENIINEDEKLFLEKNGYEKLKEYVRKSYFIISPHSNERLVRQSGAFVVPTFLTLKDKILEKSHSTMEKEFDEEVLIIPQQFKTSIRSELDFFNINEATMFPELEHQMTYIQCKNDIDVGVVPVFDETNILQYEEDDFNLLIPNVDKILNILLPAIDDKIKNQLAIAINEKIKFIDWKQKETIRSQIKLECKRILQSYFSVTECNYYSTEIIKNLLSPTEDMI